MENKLVCQGSARQSRLGHALIRHKQNSGPPTLLILPHGSNLDTGILKASFIQFIELPYSSFPLENNQ